MTDPDPTQTPPWPSLAEPTHCGDCGTVFHFGDSAWRSAGDHWQHRCPGHHPQSGHLGRGVMPTPPPPPPDAEVEAALAHLESFTVPRVPTRLTASIATVRTHIATLTARVRELEMPRPPDAALPGVEIALERLVECAGNFDMRTTAPASEDGDTIRAHIAALTAQNAALVAERDEARAEADALRGELLVAQIQHGNAELRSSVNATLHAAARLKAQGEAPSDE